MEKKLYLVHCGFYDQDLCNGVFESHVNFFEVAGTPAEAKSQAKLRKEVLQKRMHIDGIQEIQVPGYQILLTHFDCPLS